MQQGPDFMILGGRTAEGGVWMMASKSLGEASVDHDVAYRDIYSDCRGGVQRVVVTAMMRDYVMVLARDYAEAWDTLFQEWQPDTQRGLPGQKALS